MALGFGDVCRQERLLSRPVEVDRVAGSLRLRATITAKPGSAAAKLALRALWGRAC